MGPLTLIICTCILASLLYYFLRKTPHGLPLPPGPMSWPVVGNLLQLGPKPHRSLEELARVHGPLLHLRMGFVHVVVAASAAVAEQFLRVHEDNFLSRPPNSGAKHIAYNYQDLVFAPYGPRWRLLRKMCAQHLFSNKSLDDFCHVRQEEVGILTRALVSVSQAQAPARLDQMISVCVTNVIARMMLGRRVVGHDHGGGGDVRAEEFREMVVEALALAGVFNVSDFIPPLEGLDLQGVAARMKKLHRRLDAFLDGILEEHKAKGSRGGDEGHVDLLSMLISLKDKVDDGEGGQLNDTRIKALLLNLFIAGTDTSSTTIEWGIAELIRNPRMMGRAQQELDSVVGKDRLVTESDLPRLTFFNAFMKENFRLHPSTPLSLPRIAHENCEVNGYFIPKGSILLVNIWAIGRDPNTWTDPLEFRPERFLSVQERGIDYRLIPFGAGRRICAGMGLGLRMIQLLTATLIHAFHFELGNGQSAQNLSMDEAYGLGLRRAHPLLLHPTPKLSHHLYQLQS